MEVGLYEAVTLRDIEVERGLGLAHKKFDGVLRRKDASMVSLRWQNLYLCRKVAGRWRGSWFHRLPT